MMNVVKKAYAETESENWEHLKNSVKEVKTLLLAFESNWRDREARFRPLDI
jgi:hypothetical protein